MNKIKDMNIKDIVKNNTVSMLYYRQNIIYFWVMVNNIKYSFPVPLDDVKDATLNNVEKAITYMRYIRLALKYGTFVRVYENKGSFNKMVK